MLSHCASQHIRSLHVQPKMTFSERVLCFITLFCFLNLTRPLNFMGDTLLQGHQLTATSCLATSSGISKLCFFPPYYGSQDNEFYLAITVQNYAYWTANRDMPIHGPVFLTIDEHGSMKILSNEGHTTIELYSAEAGSNNKNVSAILLETGNFVLRETNPDGSVKRVLWQSFDYPTDTVIPGMKLGFDRETGHGRSLTSKRSDYSVWSGSFSLGLDPKTNQLVMWWRREILWSSGKWNNGSFGSLNSSLYTQDFNFTYFSNGSVTYFKYASVSGYINLSPWGTINGGSVASYSCFNTYFLCGCSMPKSPKCREDVGLYLPSSNSFGERVQI